MDPLLAAELLVRATLQKEAVGNVDKAVLKYVVGAPIVGGAAIYAGNKVMGDPIKNETLKHKLRMRRTRATFDPRTGRMI